MTSVRPCACAYVFVLRCVSSVHTVTQNYVIDQANTSITGKRTYSILIVFINNKTIRRLYSRGTPRSSMRRPSQKPGRPSQNPVRPRQSDCSIEFDFREPLSSSNNGEVRRRYIPVDIKAGWP